MSSQWQTSDIAPEADQSYCSDLKSQLCHQEEEQPTDCLMLCDLFYFGTADIVFKAAQWSAVLYASDMDLSTISSSR